jgi:hypothetical protein
LYLGVEIHKKESRTKHVTMNKIALWPQDGMYTMLNTTFFMVVPPLNMYTN